MNNNKGLSQEQTKLFPDDQDDQDVLDVLDVSNDNSLMTGKTSGKTSEEKIVTDMAINSHSRKFKKEYRCPHNVYIIYSK